jgi:hypothetical protein
MQHIPLRADSIVETFPVGTECFCLWCVEENNASVCVAVSGTLTNPD